MNLNNLRIAWRSQKDSAKLRGIEWLMSFEEWLQIWAQSGHLHERGRKKGQYCMARFGDVGPYAIDNVKIILHGANVSEALLGKERPDIAEQNSRLKTRMKFSNEVKARMSAGGKGKVFSKEHIDKIAAAHKGTKRTSETKKKMREAWDRRRANAV